jgi:uncharacterized protein YhdP
MTNKVSGRLRYSSGKQFSDTVTAEVLSVWKANDETIWFGFRDDKKELRVEVNLPGNVATILAKTLSMVADGHALNIEIQLPP